MPELALAPGLLVDRSMPKQPQPREETADDPDVAVDPEASPSLFDDEEDLDSDDLDEEDIEEEEIDLDDLAAMEGPDA